MIISGYRGDDKGMQALNRTELLTMLKQYREKKVAPIKREHDMDVDGEHDDEVVIMGSKRQKCRQSQEVIVLD